VLALACLTFTLPAGAQSARTKLDDARTRVAELEGRIMAGEARVTSLKNRLNALSAQVGRESVELGRIRSDLTTTKQDLEETKAHLTELRNRMRTRARTVYMRGPTALLDVILGSNTFTEFTGRIVYAAALARQDAKLVQQVRKAEAKLDEQREAQERLEGAQAAQVSALSRQQAAVRSTFAAQLGAVADLARQRIEAARLVSELETQLGPELAGLRRVAGHGMTISYGQWAAAFLGALGAPASRNNMVAVVAWEAAEGTQATWNPLATTYHMPGATVYNSHGVRNFTSREQGIEASILTLKRPNHGYERIIATLKASADPMESGEAINRSDWCRGCAGGSYVIGIIPAVEEYYDRYAN
jgi:peptidoglycan hydrolase CwlO-like protein